MEKLRNALVQQGHGTFVHFGRKFRSIDDGDRKLVFDEFVELFRSLGLTKEVMPEADIKEVFNTLDADGSGGVVFKELLEVFIPPPSPARLEIVKKAFEKADKTGDGIVSLDDLKLMYNLESDPQYKCGKKDKDQVLTEFLNIFEKDEATRDGKVTFDEFQNYYVALGRGITDDEIFITTVKDTWGME